MLGGDTVSGKTYAWFRRAKAEYDRCIRDNVPKDQWPKFFVLDTDDTCPKFMADGDEFDYLYYENGGNIYPYPAFSWEECAASAMKIHQTAKKGDFIVCDVINRVYEYACEAIAAHEGIDITNVLMRKKGFGAFNPDQWLKVRNLFDSIVNLWIYHNQANLILVTHIKEMLDVKDRERQELLLTFDVIGFKPEGAPKLPAKMDTIVFLWASHKIPRDDGGRRQGKAYSVRYLTVLKDRGIVGFQQIIYDMDFHLGLAEVRQMQREARVERARTGESPNLTGTEGQALLDEQVAIVAERAFDKTGLDGVETEDGESVNTTTGEIGFGTDFNSDDEPLATNPFDAGEA